MKQADARMHGFSKNMLYISLVPGLLMQMNADAEEADQMRILQHSESRDVDHYSSVSDG